MLVQLRGGSQAQSSSIQCFDAALGIRHRPGRLGLHAITVKCVLSKTLSSCLIFIFFSAVYRSILTCIVLCNCGAVCHHFNKVLCMYVRTYVRTYVYVALMAVLL